MLVYKLNRVFSVVEIFIKNHTDTNSAAAIEFLVKYCIIQCVEFRSAWVC